MQTILLADDDQDLLESLGFFLRQNGYQTIYAKDGTETLTKAVEFKPDLILLDITMPNISGLCTCRVIRNLERVKMIPIIMLTAKGEIGDVKAAFDAGANDYIPKPFEMDQVLKKIEESLGSQAGKNKKSNIQLTLF